MEAINRSAVHSANKPCFDVVKLSRKPYIKFSYWFIYLLLAFIERV